VSTGVRWRPRHARSAYPNAGLDGCGLGRTALVATPWLQSPLRSSSLRRPWNGTKSVAWGCTNGVPAASGELEEGRLPSLNSRMKSSARGANATSSARENQRGASGEVRLATEHYESRHQSDSHQLLGQRRVLGHRHWLHGRPTTGLRTVSCGTRVTTQPCTSMGVVPTRAEDSPGLQSLDLADPGMVLGGAGEGILHSAGAPR
jgi:hypothetical protein